MIIGLLSGCSENSSIKVTAINSISDNNVIEVAYGTNKAEALPDTVEVTLSNNETDSVPVNWNDGEPRYDKNTAGTYTFKGTLDLSDTNYSNPDNLVATVDLVIKAKNEVPKININKSTDNLKTTIMGSVTDSDGTVEEVVVDWGDGNLDTITNNFDSIKKTHTYADSGEYTITVIATDDDGDSNNEEMDLIFYELNIKTDGEGDTNPDSGIHIFEKGTEISINAIPNDGWKFIGWTGSFTGINSNTTITMNQDKNITALFVKKEYTLNINTSGEGNIKPSEGGYSYKHGREIILEAIPAEGWKFVEWSGDISSANSMTKVIMNEDKNITAVFIKKETTKELTIDTSGEGTVTPAEGTHEYEEGKEVTLEAIPADGWEFVEWSGDISRASSTITITMDGNKNVTSVFEEEVSSNPVEVWSFKGHSEKVNSVVVDNDGYVYSGSQDGTVKKIDSDGNEVWSFDKYTYEEYSNADYYDLAVNSKGYIYSVNNFESRVKIGPNGKEVWENTMGIVANSVTIDSEGYVYLGSISDGTIKKIKPDGKEVWDYEFPIITNSITVDSAGYIYIGSFDGTVMKISSDRNEIWRFKGHSDDVYDIAIDNNGNVYSGSQDGTVKKIDSSGNEVWSFEKHTSAVMSVAVDSDGNVYSGSEDNTVRKINSDGNQVWSFKGHSSDVNSIAVDSDGYVYSGSEDGTVKKIKQE